jgi:putative ABC transport system permease protein
MIFEYIGIAAKDIKRQIVRSLLTIVALLISTTILVLMMAISIGGQQAVVSQFGSDDSLTSIAVTPNQSSSAFSPFGSVQEVNNATTKLDDAAVAQLAATPHVMLATPRAAIWEFDQLSIEGSTKAFVAQAEGAASDAHVELSAGMFFGSNDDTGKVVLGYGYAKELGNAGDPQSLVGKTVTITTQKGYRGVGAGIPAISATAAQNDAFNHSVTTLQATIVGVTSSGPDQNKLLIPLGWAHQIRTARYATPRGEKTVDQLANNGYTTIQVRADAVDNVKSVSDTIAKEGYGQISTLSQIERLQQFTTLMWAILGSVALVAVIAAALGVVNTMLMTVSEQSHTIGVWRANGARKGFIIKLFLVEAGMLGFIGGVIGVGIGALASQFVNEYTMTLLKAQDITLTDIALLPPWLPGAAVAVTTLFGILAGLYPAWRAARQDPSLALSSGQ